MIYTNRLSQIVRKAYGKDKVEQLAVERLESVVVLNPSSTGANAIILEPKDLAGMAGARLDAALTKKHSDVLVMCFYKDEKEISNLVSKKTIMMVKYNGKLTPEYIKEEFDKALQNKTIDSGKFQVDGNQETKIREINITGGPEVIEYENKVEEQPQSLIFGISDPDATPTQYLGAEATEGTESPEVTQEDKLSEESGKPLEERIGNLNMFQNYKTFKHHLEREEIIKDLVKENTQYQAALQQMEILDREIATIFRSTEKTAEEKLQDIRQKAMERTGYKEFLNNSLVEKTSNVIVAAVASAEQASKDQLSRIKAAVAKIEERKLLWSNREELNRTIQERLELQVTLTESMNKILDLFNLIDEVSRETASGLDDGLPTTNAYINQQLNSVERFNTSNAGELASKIMSKLADGSVRLSAVEAQLKEMIQTVMTLCDKDALIIDYQQKLIDLLSSQQVEDAVIIDTVLKSCLRVFVGPNYVGTRTTAIAWAGMMSRKQNIVLLDLTGRSAFQNYGIRPFKLADFKNERLEERFACVEGKVNSVDELRELVSELKNRLNYYPFISIILDDTQVDLLNEIKTDALTVHFVTDSSARSMSLMRSVISRFESDNVAKKLVVINPALDIISMTRKLGVDPMTTKVCIVPNIPKMQILEANGIPPHEDSEVLEIFEEAFR